MICPFRANTEFEYRKVESKNGEEDSYLEMAQRMTYPKCYEHECPFWDEKYYQCDRVKD